VYTRRTLLIISAALVVEAIVVVLFPSRIPRPARAIIAGTNAVAIAALWLVSRQRGK
jgi:hypothetical protein